MDGDGRGRRLGCGPGWAGGRLAQLIACAVMALALAALAGGRALAQGPCFTQASGSPVGVGNQPVSVAVGNFNGDSFLDLAVANQFSNNVTILLGQGNGQFTPAPGSPVSVGNQPVSVAVGNFNGDSFLDLAVANVGSNNVTILLGNGNGTFTQAPGSPVSVAPGNGPVSVA